MNSSILKDVMDGKFSEFQEEFESEVDSHIKERLEAAKEGLPNLINSELGLAENGPEDEDEEDPDEDDEDENLEEDFDPVGPCPPAENLGYYRNKVKETQTKLDNAKTPEEKTKLSKRLEFYKKHLANSRKDYDHDRYNAKKYYAEHPEEKKNRR
jgi:hypothetical protein